MGFPFADFKKTKLVSVNGAEINFRQGINNHP